MGGGVSLGTFCGTALSQALKLLIVYGRDTSGAPFEKIEVDVFSGASAGTLSLAAMLRCLATPDPAALAIAKTEVEKEFGTALDALSREQLKDLYAAQAVQNFQKKLWSEEITLDRLLGTGGDGQLRYKASLLDRGAVDQIAQTFIVDAPASDFGLGRLLAERVLFACAITNLTPVVCDAENEFPGKEVGFIGLNDGMRSSTHRELRVFDLNLTEIEHPEDPIYPDRWCLYHLEGAQKKMVGDLRKREAWAQIAATAIASGAFPGAFEPVVLTRKSFEFGPHIWNRIMDRSPGAKTTGQETIAFSYVDGGVLNNEPIREAFRLASFIDGHDRLSHPDAQVQRLIVFVDPNVAETRPSYRVPGHRAWTVDDPNYFGSLDGFDLRRLSSLERLVPHLAGLLGAITDESGVIEADKIYQVQHLFAVREGIREALYSALTDQSDDADILRLIDFCQERLAWSKADEMIPPGPMTLPGELERVCHEERNSTWGGDLFKKLRGGAENFIAAMSTKPPTAVANKNLWLRALSFVAVDLILGLQGKLEDASLVAIAPFKNLQNATAANPPEPIILPGHSLSGFAGFMSNLPDKVEHAAASYCAAEFLIACGLIDPATPVPSPAGLKLSDTEQAQFERDVQNGLVRLGDRIGEMVRLTRLWDKIPGANTVIGLVVSAIIKSKIKGVDWRDRQELACTFRVRVSNESFEFDGRGIGDKDCSPVKNPTDGSWELVTVATWDGANWEGGYVTANRLDIDQDGSLFTPDKDVCEIKLPDRAIMAKCDYLPNPTFFLDLTTKPKTKLLEAEEWTALPGVVPLETTL